MGIVVFGFIMFVYVAYKEHLFRLSVWKDTTCFIHSVKIQRLCGQVNGNMEAICNIVPSVEVTTPLHSAGRIKAFRGGGSTFADFGDDVDAAEWLHTKGVREGS